MEWRISHCPLWCPNFDPWHVRSLINLQRCWNKKSRSLNFTCLGSWHNYPPKKKRNFWTSISEPSEFHLSSRMLSLFLGAWSGRHKGWIRIRDEVLYLLKCFCCVPPPEKIRMWVFFLWKNHEKSPPTDLFFGVKQRVWFEHIETIRVRSLTMKAAPHGLRHCFSATIGFNSGWWFGTCGQLEIHGAMRVGMWLSHYIHYLSWYTGWWFGTWILFSHILGMS